MPLRLKLINVAVKTVLLLIVNNAKTVLIQMLHGGLFFYNINPQKLMSM